MLYSSGSMGLPHRIGCSVGIFVLCASSGAARAASPDEHARPLYVRAYTDAGAGVGFRFNNPYRLPTILGSDAESVSRTAPYTSLGVGALLGNPFGYQHGAQVRWDVALTGVAQHVITPSYVFARRAAHFGAHVRLGFPIVLGPEFTGGAELGAAGTYYFLAGVGVRAELIGTFIGGAATEQRKRTLYPILSGQLAVVYEWERL